MDHGVVQRWLRQVLAPYNDRDKVYADVDRTLIAMSSLSPKTEVYTHDDGREQLLLVLSGTIPIQYRISTYNIPMSFWIPHSYPRDPPIVYVTPTNDMLVRKGKFVDLSGRVNGEYMDMWKRKWEACNLLDLLHSCQAIFGQEPPVYAKPKSPVAPIATSSSIRSNHNTINEQEVHVNSGKAKEQFNGPPLRPPKPGQSIYDSQQRSASIDSQTGFSPNQAFRSPELPQRSPEQQSRHSSWNGNQQMPLRQGSFHAAPSPLPPPLPHHPGQNPQLYQQRTPSLSPSQQIQSQHIVAPPRPPNPELLQLHALLHAKIQDRLNYLFQTTEESNKQLKLLGDDLDRGELAIKDEMARLEVVRDVCRSTGDRLEQSVEQAERRIKELRSKEEPDVDGILSATSLVGNQMIDLVAEDNAIEDTLYHLGRALNAEIIDLDRFLKQTRFLSREQFMRRALAQKIAKGMGWD